MAFGKLSATADNRVLNVTPKGFYLLRHSNHYVKCGVGKNKK